MTVMELQSLEHPPARLPQAPRLHAICCASFWQSQVGLREDDTTCAAPYHSVTRFFELEISL